MNSCPRCGGVVWGRALPAGSGHACGSCGGVWLDTAAASRMSEVLCSETLAHADAGAQLAKHAVDTRGAIACPVCGAAMDRSVAGQTRVEIDVCRAHGTWFDRDELGRVAQAHATARAYGQHGSAALAGGAAVGGRRWGRGRRRGDGRLGSGFFCQASPACRRGGRRGDRHRGRQRSLRRGRRHR